MNAEETNDNKISVVINTYNAEKFLSQVLDSVKDFDEVVVCDMESTDHTVDIARDSGCRVVTFPKNGYVCAEPARTFAIQSARSKWVLVVDADELVTPELRQYLYTIIERPDCPQGLYIPRRNRTMNRLDRGRLKDFQLRFFIREGTVWPPYVHTFPTVKGRVERLTDDPRAVLIHLDEGWLSDRMEKTNRYTDGELEKRAGKHYGVGSLLWRPVWRFFKSYVMDGGFRNGVPGYVNSVIAGFYQFLLVAKSMERDIRLKQEAEDKDTKQADRTA